MSLENNVWLLTAVIPEKSAVCLKSCVQLSHYRLPRRWSQTLKPECNLDFIIDFAPGGIVLTFFFKAWTLKGSLWALCPDKQDWMN